MSLLNASLSGGVIDMSLSTGAYGSLGKVMLDHAGLPQQIDSAHRSKEILCHARSFPVVRIAVHPDLQLQIQ